MKVEEMNGMKRFIGLMFQKGPKTVQFNFPEPVDYRIHTWFVSKPITCYWYDETGSLIEKRVITPWQAGVRPVKRFVRLVEVML